MSEELERQGKLISLIKSLWSRLPDDKFNPQHDRYERRKWLESKTCHTLSAILGLDTEGTAAPGGATQIPMNTKCAHGFYMREWGHACPHCATQRPQSSPDAPPVQRGVSKDALEWLGLATCDDGPYWRENNARFRSEILAALAHKEK